MITINKKYLIQGTGPFKFTATSTSSLVKVTPYTGTTNDYVELTVQIDSQYQSPSLQITLGVESTSGCTESQTFLIDNPCTDFTSTQPLLFTAPNQFSIPILPFSVKSYEWRVGANLSILGSSTDSQVSVKEKVNSSTNQHSVSCTLTNYAGCQTTLYGMYTTCSTKLEPFLGTTQCARYDDLFLGGIDFGQGNNKVTSIDFKYYLSGKNCPGCEFNYSKIEINSSGHHYHSPFGQSGVIEFIDNRASVVTTYSYTIPDNCGNIYSGQFSLPIANCNTGAGCWVLPSGTMVTASCADINQSAVNQPSLGCGDTLTGDEYYVYVSPPIYGSNNPTVFDWTSFTFIVPTNNGTPISGYTLSPSGQCMTTPYGFVTIDNNHKIVYAITKNPPFNTNISELFMYIVYDNTPARCVSSVGSSIVVHTCVGDPTADPVSACAPCMTTKEVDLDSYINLYGLTLDNILLDLTGVNTTLVTITPDVANKKIIINSSLLKGTVTFKYKVVGSLHSTPNTTKESPWANFDIDFTCAGTSQSIVSC